MTPTPNEPKQPEHNKTNNTNTVRTDQVESSSFEDKLTALEEAAVAWHLECERDIAESGYPMGDGKELRRARKNALYAHNQSVTRAVREALERVRDNSSGGGSWRRVIEQVLAELERP